MKKVLFVATVTSHINAFHLPYLELFKKKGWKTYVATGDKNPVKNFCDKKIVIPISRSPYKINNLKAIKQLRQIIDKEHFDIIHCHTPMGSVVTRLAAKNARKNGTRVIYTAHGFHFYKGAPLKNWLLFYPTEKYLAKYTDTLITINQEDFARAKKKFSKRCHDIQYIPGVGVDPKKFDFKMTAKEKHDLRASLGLKDDDFVMIFPAELSNRKNQLWLIKTLSELMRNNNKIHLLLPGKDSLNGACQTLARKLHLENQIYFLGYRSDIPKLLKISNLALSSSKQEGLPVNLLESASVSLPIVATNCRGNYDVCAFAHGLLSEQNDSKAFVKNIIKVHTSKMRSSLNDDFLLNNTLKLTEKIYDKKKRILHVLASNKFSGAENVACVIIKNLSDKYDMAYCSPNGSIKNALDERGITYFSVKKLNHKNLKKVIDDYRPDIIHAHDFKASFIASTFAEECVVISQLHKNDPQMKKKSLKSILFLLKSRKFSKIVGVSNSILNEYIYKNKIKPKYTTIENYVDKNAILEKADAFKVKKSYDLFFFGRLSDEKNPLEFIEIVKALNDPNIKCVMVGDGPLHEKCKTRIEEYNLEKNIDMVGFQSNPYPYIKATRIGVMPSKYEGFGLTAIEASILGKPVLNSGAGKLSEIYTDTPYICKGTSDYLKNIVNKKIKKTKVHQKYNARTYRKAIIDLYQ